MDEQFDDELKKRIREVFDNFEDPSADKGWLQLRKKYPEEKPNRRAIAWIWWAAAALLFLFLGIGVWLFNKNDQPLKYSVKHTKHPQSENLATAKNQQDTIGKTAQVHAKNTIKPNVNNIASTSSNRSKKSVTANKNKPAVVINPIISNDNTGGGNHLAKTVNGHRKLVNQAPSQQLAATVDKNKIKPNVDNIASAKTPATINKNLTNAAINPKISNDTADKKTYIAKTVDSSKKTIIQSPAQQLATTNQANNSNTASVVVKPKQPARSINDMLAENNAVKTKTIGEKYKTVHLGVYAGTYFNYAKGSNNQVNAGLGVTADIKITDNLKLVTGITVAQNSLNFSTGVPTSAAQASFASPGIASSGIAAPGFAAAPSEFSINSLVTEASVPAFKNYDASLVGLDIPLNLKYEFNPQKNDIYFLAGLSSGTFINETYTYQYNYPALASPTLQQVQEETSRRSFNGFYFAKTLNLAFGIGYPLGKNRIVLEPFLKYPLEGLGSQNIRFGAGGLNLKFDFERQKK